MSSPDHVAVAELMLAKARADLSAARLLANHEDQDDGIIGFHAQQACEKALKAMLAVAAVDIPLTHNLQYLIELVEPAVGEEPDAARGLGWLNPWAVTMRYQHQRLPSIVRLRSREPRPP